MSKYSVEEKQAWKEEQIAAQESMLEDAFLSFTSSEAWANWVRFGRVNLSRLTFTNALLIWSQNPEATVVWGKGQWAKQGVNLNEDARALRYFAPVFGNKYENGQVVMKDGKPVKVLKFFRTVEGYDITDTDATVSLKTHVPVEGDDLVDFIAPLESYARSLGIFVIYEDSSEVGRTEDGAILIGKHQTANTIVAALVRELAKVYGGINYTNYTPEDAEVMVEAATVMVLGMAGFDMSNAAVPYIAEWADGDPKMLKKYVHTIDDLVRTLTDKMGV